MIRTTLAIVALATGTLVQAAPIVPQADFYGTLAGATFGGSGIPNNPAAVTAVPSGNSSVTLGLIVTPRFSSNPPVIGGLNGIYQVTPGIDPNTPPSDRTGNYAKWNFDFYIGGNFTDHAKYRLYYDFDPTPHTDQDSLGYVEFDAIALSTALGRTPAQDSWNLGMDFLENALIVTPPTYLAATADFDPEVTGEYGFALVAYDLDEDAPAANTFVEVGRAAILVDVVQANNVPEPGTLALVGLALAGLAGFRRRKV